MPSLPQERVRLVIDEMGFMKTPDEDETSNLIWCDSAVQQEKIAELQNYQDHLIVQEYIEKPFLMEGYKFDLRIYILVTSCDPLKIFLYHDGLVRMGTEKYIPPNESNLTQLYMHLTNYSVNKHNERFERDETENKGSKRSIKWFTEFLQANQHDVAKFWSDISELVVKTLIVAEPHVLHAYRMCRPGQPPGSESVCFEVLGFDILLDRKLKPWLLEGQWEGRIQDEKKQSLHKREHLSRVFKTVESREEDILDLLEQCEIDDEKLMGKTAKPRGPKPLSAMPESSEIMKRQKYSSSDSSPGSSSSSSESEDSEEDEHRNKKKEKQVTYNLKQPNHYKLIQQSSSIRRSVSCPRSISSPSPSSADNRPFSAQQMISASRPTSASRSQSLNRASSYVRPLPQSNDGSSNPQTSESLRQLRTKEQEDDLTSQTLFVLKDMKIRFPGKSDAESLLLIKDIIDNWKYHKTKVASYWLIKLDSVKQRKVLDIVKTSIRTVLPRIWKVPDVEEVSLYRIFNRVFNRLLWSRGQGLWNCFCDSGQMTFNDAHLAFFISRSAGRVIVGTFLLINLSVADAQ
ncbi:hypothetical protein CB1_001326030 [Camelus ferus]|nr:hypothetical protein CB1_001326030 [Camelus ferus]